MKKKAKDITGHPIRLFEEAEDIAWMFDVLIPLIPNFKGEFTKENTDGVILVGDETSPKEVWLTRWTDRKDGIPANHLQAVYTLAGRDL